LQPNDLKSIYLGGDLWVLLLLKYNESRLSLAYLRILLVELSLKLMTSILTE